MNICSMSIGVREEYSKRKTALLGLIFLILLVLAYAENLFFFGILGAILQNSLLAILMLFTHNVLVVSLIVLGMTFYVRLVFLDFFKREKYSHIIVSHPSTFGFIFACVIVFLSILRGATLIVGRVDLLFLPLILLISTPIGIIEGYGIYLPIKKTLSRTLSSRSLMKIYIIFFVASVLEVVFINLLAWSLI
ncbi:MAG: hypothetical protein NWF10_07900 [Candidatus Bathyarchaeota archaeon]|nr:hypothetical protein [Candidatus Bathyarchaeota archaeon]